MAVKTMLRTWRAVLVALAATALVMTGCGGGSSKPAKPTAPTGVTATPGDTLVTLAWTAVSGATSYNVYYGTSAGVTTAGVTTAAAGTLLSDVTSPVDVTGLTNDTTYFFIVTAVNAGGESDASAEVSAVPAVNPAPAAPTGVTATPGDTQITLAWTDVTDATSYNVYYGTSAGVTPTTGTLASDVTSPHDVTGLTNATTYYFIVTAVNANGESTASAEVSATPATVPAPAAPTGVIATAGDGMVTLAWDDVTGATSYNVYYATSSGVTPATGTPLDDVASPLEISSLTNDTTYYFIVTASNTGGESDASTEVSATPSTAPFIQATVLSLAGGSNPIGWLQQVQVCTDGTCNTPITTATVTVNSTTLTYNVSDEAYEGSAVIAAGGAVALTVTVDGIDYTASGTQFTSAPAISVPASNASWAADSAHDITWNPGAPTTGAAYIVGIFDGSGNIVYPTSGDGPKEVAIGTTTDTVPANTLSAGSYSVMVGIGTAGIIDNTGGIPIADAISGSGLWLGSISALVPITVTAPQPQGPYISALVLSLESGTNYLPFLQQVEVCTDATCSTPVTDATVKVNGTTLTYNSGNDAYEGNVPVAKGAAVTVSVTTSGGYTYTASGTQFTTFPAITAPTNGASWTATNANTISWTAVTGTSGATYAVGVINTGTGNFAYPAGDTGPKAVAIGTISDIVPANTLTTGDYVVLVGIGTAGIADNTGGLPFANTVSGSGLWIGGLAPFVTITVP